MADCVTRFAPSPTGLLHLGHAHAALFAARHARAAGGRFLLRLEDIDPARCRAEYADAILDDLRWLGLHWDGAVRVQSVHLAAYQSALTALARRGLLYPCFCSRADIAQAASAPHAAPPTGSPAGLAPSPDGGAIYPGTCRGLSAAWRAARIAAGAPHAWRLDMARAVAATPGELAVRVAGPDGQMRRVVCRPAAFGDVVLGRRDAPASYHLCVCHDDAVQGVTLVTRGEDLRAATDLHRLLQALFGWPVPDYAYHPLLTNAAGRRLAKRDSAASLRALRQAGIDAATVRAMAGWPGAG